MRRQRTGRVEWRRWARGLSVALLLVAGGCAISTAPPGGETRREPAGRSAPAPSARKADPRDVARLTRIMVPLIRAANRPRPLDQVKVGIIDDRSVNAANAGGGEFYVTRGLLERANDEQLTAVLAHEVAHDDLGHVAKAQALGAGVGLGAAILEQIFPGTGQIAPIAGTLITRAYSRREELAADRHGVEILKRAGSSKEAMERTLVWLKGIAGGEGGGGGFFATHPGTDERIEALRQLR